MMKKMVMKKPMMKMRTQTTLVKMQCQPEAQAAVAAAQLQQQKQQQQQAAAAATIVVYTVKKIVHMHLDYRAAYDTPQLVKQQQTETNRYV